MPEQPDLVSLIRGALSGPRVGVGISLPGEFAIAAAFAYAQSVRETMDTDLRARLDAVMVQSIEDIHKLWRGLWVGAGLLEV